MRKNYLKSTFVVVAVVASCFGGFKTYDLSRQNGNLLLLENVEALSDYLEVITTWKCDNSHKYDCQMFCGRCTTVVMGRGNGTGSHTCVFVETPKDPVVPCNN